MSMVSLIVELLLGSSFLIGTIPCNVTYFVASITFEVRVIFMLVITFMMAVSLPWRLLVSFLPGRWFSSSFSSMGS